MGLQLVSAKALPARKGNVQKMARRDVIDSPVPVRDADPCRRAAAKLFR